MRTFLLSAALIALAGTSSAQVMKPLAEVTANATDNYAPARCAGLYQAMLEWIGAERMGEDTWRGFNTARENLILFSAVIARSKSGGTIEHQTELAVRDVRNIADLYIARMENNYAAVGQAFGEDELIVSDLTLCQDIAEAIQ